MQIPDYKKAADPQLDTPSSLKPLPVLAAVFISPSMQLLYFYRIIYLFFALCLPSVVFPWLIINPALSLLVLAGWWGLWVSHKYQQKNLFTGALWFEREDWLLQAKGQVVQKCKLNGEVLCWPLLIILPLIDPNSGQRTHLLIARDSLSPADRARLYTWLRICLAPNV